MTGWISNDEETAKKLRQVDRAYDKAVKAANYQPLVGKIVALRAAKLARQQAYDLIMTPTQPTTEA